MKKPMADWLRRDFENEVKRLRGMIQTRDEALDAARAARDDYQQQAIRYYADLRLLEHEVAALREALDLIVDEPLEFSLQHRYETVLRIARAALAGQDERA